MKLSIDEKDLESLWLGKGLLGHELVFNNNDERLIQIVSSAHQRGASMREYILRAIKTHVEEDQDEYYLATYGIICCFQSEATKIAAAFLKVTKCPNCGSDKKTHRNHLPRPGIMIACAHNWHDL